MIFETLISMSCVWACKSAFRRGHKLMVTIVQHKRWFCISGEERREWWCSSTEFGAKREGEEEAAKDHQR